MAKETNDSLYNETGSTLTGTGVAVALRAKRKLRLAGDVSILKSYLGDVANAIYSDVIAGKKVLVEGAQAYGLSNYHGQYPFVTSRDTTVAATISQLGIGHKMLTNSILVFKCFPTRNLIGNGRLVEELHLENEQLADVLGEFGGGSYKGGDLRRRVALFDFDLATRAIQANTPDMIAITGLDRLSASLKSPRVKSHYGSTTEFTSSLKSKLNLPIGLESWGPFVEDIVDRR